MKKLPFLILTFSVSFSLLAARNVYSFDEFVKSEESKQTITYLPEYDSLLHTHVFKQGNSLKGIFTARDETGKSVLVLADEENPNQWVMKKKIFEDGDEISAPRVLFIDESHVRIFYTKAGDRYRIYSIDCDQEFNCSGIPNLAINPVETWEYKGVGSGFPFFKNGIYYLFYGAWGSTFQIFMATSADGLHWTKCPNPFINYGDGAFLYEADGKYYLFYHYPAGEGIRFSESTDTLSCSMRWSQSTTIVLPDSFEDQRHLIAPNIVRDKNSLYLYYSGLGVDGLWRLNLAISAPHKENVFYLIIPGFFASWNREAILHNREVSLFDWKLPEYVKEYTGLKQSLINHGFAEGEDFIFFPYDWRRSVDETTDKLDAFLQEEVWNIDPEKQVKIIGHSLGGLIGRIYLQKYPARNVGKVVTVGTPHKGITQVYEPLVTGDVPIENSYLWLIEKIMIFINKLEGENDKETIVRSLPVLYDFVPTFNFLKKVNGEEINIDDMLLNNTTLRRLNNSLPDLFDRFVAIYGEKDARTPAGYIVNEPVLNSHGVFTEDPKPISPFFAPGDYTVLSQSGKDERDPDYIRLPFDHNELIYKKEGIESVFNALSLDYDPSLIVEGVKTEISPSLVFMMQSPAEMEVVFADKVYKEEDGIIFIPGAQTGQYALKVKGLEQGSYTVSIGEISKNNDYWYKIRGSIVQDPPDSQIDAYKVDFNSETILIPTPIPTVTEAVPTPTDSTNQNSSSSTQSTSSPTPTPTLVPSPTIEPTLIALNENNEEVGLPQKEEVLGEADIPSKVISQTSSGSRIIIYFLIGIFMATSGGIFFFYKKYSR